MRTISCQHLGFACEFEAVGDVEEMVYDLIFLHITDVHEDKWRAMSEEEQEDLLARINVFLFEEA